MPEMAAELPSPADNEIILLSVRDAMATGCITEPCSKTLTPFDFSSPASCGYCEATAAATSKPNPRRPHFDQPNDSTR